MRNVRVALTILSFFALSANTYGQGISFTHLTVENGLSHNDASSILKDHQGFIWVGTENGLNRFDGYDVEVFRHIPEDSSSLMQGTVNRMMEDSRGNIWLSAGGLNLFNREQATFTHFHFDQLDTSFNHSTQINAMLEDRRGHLWFGTYTGLYLFNHENLTIKRFIYSTDSLRRTNSVRALWDYDPEHLLVGTEGRGLQLFNRITGQFFPFTAGGSHVMDGKEVYAITIDHKKRIWLGSRGEGLAMVDSDRTGVRYFSKPNVLPDDYVYALGLSDDGTVWVATDGGLCAISEDLKMFDVYRSEANDNHSLTSNSLVNLTVDDTGILWIATRFGGVNYYNPLSKKFKHVTHLTSSLSHNFVTGFEQAYDGKVWVATDGGGVNLYDPSSNTIKHLSAITDGRQFSGNKAQSIKLDSKGNLWVALWDGGVDRYNLRSRSFKNYSKSSGLGVDETITLAIDNDQDLWVGTWKRGPFRYNTDSDSFDQFPLPHHSNELLSEAIVNGIIEDHAGSIWFATQTDGVFIYSKPNDHIKHFYRPLSAPDQAISSNRVLSVFQDSRQMIWLGTNGGGLNLFNPYDSTFTSFTRTNGLPSDVVYGILEDDMGFLWISTNQGVAKLSVQNFFPNPDVEVVNKFDVSDGLQGNQFHRGSFFKADDGILFFGGIEGFNMIDPYRMRTNVLPPPVFLTGFSLFNRDVTVSDTDSPLEKHVTMAKELTLSHTQSVITFRYAALNFTNIHKNSYAYYLEPFEQDWNYVGGRREATYTNLDPGTYTFHVKAANNDGVWNEQGRSLTITITPPWWRTWWFRLLALLFVLLTISTLYGIRIRFLSKQRKYLQRLVEERTKELSVVNSELVSKQQAIAQQNDELENQANMLTESNTLLEERFQQIEEQNSRLASQKEELEAQHNSLDEANGLLQKLNVTKDKFFSIIAHDLKGPFNVLIGFTELLIQNQKNYDKETIIERIKVINESSQKIYNLLLNLLEWARSQRGVIEPNFTVFNFSNLVNQNIQLLNEGIESKNLTIDTTGIKAPVEVFADKDLMNTVVRNLLSNAVKFTADGGGITISTDYDKGGFLFTITDTGMGIPSNILPKLFSIGENQIKREGTSNESGTGLGLIICKELVDLHGGTIKVESTDGEGSTFQVNIPQRNFFR